MRLRYAVLLAVPASALLALIISVNMFGSTHSARALPPAGTDELNAGGTVAVTTRLGKETLFLSGSATIQRQDPHMEGGVEVANAEITSMSLTGTSSAGEVTATESTTRASLGEIRSLQAPPTQFPASSFFDVFIDVSVPASPSGTLALHNEQALRLIAQTSLTGWPPTGVKYQLVPIFGVDNDGDTQIDEDTADDDGDGLVDEDRPGPDPDTPGSGFECGNDADCDNSEGEDPPVDLCPPATSGTPTLCDTDGDGQIDEDPSCVPLLNPGNTHLKAGVCVRTMSIQLGGTITPPPTNTPCPAEVCPPSPTRTATRTTTPQASPTSTPLPGPEDPTFSVAPAGPSGLHPADLLSLHETAPPPGANDDFANAALIASLPFTAEQSTVGMTTEPEEPLLPDGCIASPTPKGATVWYRFTPSSSVTVTADTFGSDFDTVLAVYTGSSFASLALVACNDDTDTLQSRVSFVATAGTRYNLQAGGYADLAGNLRLNVSAVGGSGVAGPPFVGISCARLGLTTDGCDSGSDGDQDDLDGLSFGHDFGPGSAPIAFSVAPGSTGLPGSAVSQQAACSPAQPQADEFSSTLNGTNTLTFDGDGLDGSCPTGPSLSLAERPASDDLDALTDEPPSAVDTNRDGTPDVEVFFSLAAGSPTLTTLGRSPADILWTVGGFQPGLYAPASDLGLQSGDDIDALCIADSGTGAPRFDAVTDTVYFSLAPGSPTLASLGASAADVLRAGPQLVYEAGDLGLRGADDLDAMKCFTAQGGATPTPTPAGRAGDVDCNGRVDAIDAALELQFGAGLISRLACQQNADVNGDGRINSIDAALILQFVAGLLRNLPP